MKEFFLILFFSKSILLTPTPVTLEGIVSLVPEEPISAITTGASVEIDISSIIVKGQNEGIVEFRERLKKIFHPI